MIIKRIVVFLLVIFFVTSCSESYQIGDCLLMNHFMNISNSKESLRLNNAVLKIISNDKEFYKAVVFSIKKQKLYEGLFDIDKYDLKLNKQIECPTMVDELSNSLKISKMTNQELKKL